MSTDGVTSTGTGTGGFLRRVRTLPADVKGLLVALPPFLFLALFFLVPLATVLSFSVRVQDGLQITNQLTLEPYLTVLTGGTFQSALIYSIQVSVITTAITLVFGLPVGYYLAVKVRERYRNLLVFLVIAPLWINFFVRAYAIIQIGGARGFLNGVLLAVGIVNEPVQWFVYSQPSVIFGLSALWLPLMVLPIYAMLRQMDAAWLEAARDLGAGPLRVHREVTLPAALPGIILGSLFVFLLSLGNQAVPRILGGAKQTTYSETILLQLESGSVNWPVASAASGVMMAFVLVVLLGVFSVFDMEELF